MGEPIFVPVSAGELLDKKTILEIKRERIKDHAQLANVERELALLTSIARNLMGGTGRAPDIDQLEIQLRHINSGLWDLENAVRAFERAGSFGEDFIDAARRIYAGNDARAALKRQINLLLQSSIIEEMNHT